MEHPMGDLPWYTYAKPFYDVLKRIKDEGKLVKPRGLLIKEVENCSYELPAYVRFPNFESRKLNPKYTKREVLWYLKGDRFDTSICQYAKIWQAIVNSDGSINSNYGQYVFGKINLFDRVIETLIDDPDSRRASIVILNSEHLFAETKDVPCTYAINFRIRESKLNMSVHMRSQDAIYGMGNDAPAFSIIHEMMFNALKRYFPLLQHGNYFHTCDSLHVYEKHFEMLDKIIAGDKFTVIDCPKISGPAEVDFLRSLDFTAIPEEYAFSKWLTTFE